MKNNKSLVELWWINLYDSIEPATTKINYTKEYQKAYKKAYQKTDKYKAYQKAYKKTDKYKAYQKAYQKEYYQRKKEKVKDDKNNT